MRGAGEPHGVQAQLLAGVGGLVRVFLEAELVTGTEAPDQELVAVVLLEAPEREQPRLGAAFGAEVDDVRSKAERAAGGHVKVESRLPAVRAQFQRTGLRHHQLQVLCDRPDVRRGDDQRAARMRAEARGGDFHLQRSHEVQRTVRDLQGDRLALEAVRAGEDQRAGAAQRNGCPRVAQIHFDAGYCHARVDVDDSGHRTVETGALVGERRAARVPAAAGLPAPAPRSGPADGRRYSHSASVVRFAHSAGRKVKE